MNKRAKAEKLKEIVENHINVDNAVSEIILEGLAVSESQASRQYWLIKDFIK